MLGRRCMEWGRGIGIGRRGLATSTSWKDFFEACGWYMEVDEERLQKGPQWERIVESFGRQSFMETLGAKVEGVVEGFCVIEAPLTDSLLQQNGFMHAGAVNAIMDTAGGYAALSSAPQNADVLSAGWTIDLLRPSVGSKFVALGRVVKPGKTLTRTHVEGFMVDEENRLSHVATMQQQVALIYRD